MTGYYYHTVADGVNSLCLSANRGGKVSLITKCVESWKPEKEEWNSMFRVDETSPSCYCYMPSPPPNTEDGSLLVV